LNRGYQLRFTLFMVGVSAVLMLALGLWVMRVAKRTTQVAAAQVLSFDCGAPAAEPTPTIAASDVKEVERQNRVVVVESEIQMVAPKGPKAEAIQACRKNQVDKIAELQSRERMIGFALIGSFLVILLGLFAYGIKMTHRVAGPLFKIQQYLGHLRNGRYPEVYDLRKGDHLIEFYQHFKEAYNGLRGMQTEDIAELAALLQVADETRLAEKHPEIAGALEELRILHHDKEKSLG
jgi:hypothetical protein